MAPFQVSLCWLMIVLVGEMIVGTVQGQGSSGSGLDVYLTVTATTLTSITIQWEGIENNSVMSYVIEYYPTSMPRDTEQEGVDDPEMFHFTATGLFPQTNYTFELTATDNKGEVQMSWMVTAVSAGIGLLLNGQLYDNNSIVTLDEIGEDSAALLCLTDKTDCCRSSDTREGVGSFGDWFFPNGWRVESRRSDVIIYRTRGPNRVLLHRRNNAQTTGVFSCEIPDASGVNQTLYVGVYPGPNITHSYLEQSDTFQITCTFTWTSTQRFTWIKDGHTLNDSERIQRVTNVSLGISTLQINISNVKVTDVMGSYTCIVNVGERNLLTRSIVIDRPNITETTTLSTGTDSPTIIIATNNPMIDTTDIGTPANINTPSTGITTASVTTTDTQQQMTPETPSQDINVNIQFGSMASETGVGVVISLLVLLAAIAVISLTLIHLYRTGILDCRRQTVNLSSSQKTGETSHVDSDEEREEPGYELVDRVAHDYENPDQWNREYAQVSLPVQEGHQPTGEYEFSQCPAYGTTNRSSASAQDTGTTTTDN